MYGISPRKKYTKNASVKNMKPFVILNSISVQRKPPYQGKLIYGYNIGKKDIIDEPQPWQGAIHALQLCS